MTPTHYTIEYINSVKSAKCILTAISIEKRQDKDHLVFCVCQCGNYTNVQLHNILNNHTKSCGCLRKKPTIIKYWPVNKKIYNVWSQMISRCYNIKTVGYKYYGAKGVIVCEEWRDNYQNFLDWSLANGWQKGLVLDKDTKGNGKLYSPETCCYITAIDNQRERNKRDRKYEYKGIMYCVSDLAKITGLSASCIHVRVKTGMSVEEIISTPKSKPTGAKGINHRSAKLTESDVITILQMNKDGLGYYSIWNKLNLTVSPNTVRGVVIRETWKHINLPLK